MLRKARMWRTGAEGGNRHRVWGVHRQTSFRIPAGVRLVRENPLVSVCVSQFPVQMPGQPREEADRSLLPWQLGSSGSPAEALCLLLHSKELSVPASGG